MASQEEEKNRQFLINENHAYLELENYKLLASFLNKRGADKLPPSQFLKQNWQLADGDSRINANGSDKDGFVDIDYSFSWVDVLPSNTFLFISCFLASCGAIAGGSGLRMDEFREEVNEALEEGTDPVVWENLSKGWVEKALKNGLVVPTCIKDTGVLDKIESLKDREETLVLEEESTSDSSFSADNFSAIRFSFLDKDLLVPAFPGAALATTMEGGGEFHSLATELEYESGVDYAPSLYSHPLPNSVFASVEKNILNIWKGLIEQVQKGQTGFQKQSAEEKQKLWIALLSPLCEFIPAFLYSETREEDLDRQAEDWTQLFQAEESSSLSLHRDVWGTPHSILKFFPTDLSDFPCWHYQELENEDKVNPWDKSLLLNPAELSLVEALKELSLFLSGSSSYKEIPIVYDKDTERFFLAGALLGFWEDSKTTQSSIDKLVSHYAIPELNDDYEEEGEEKQFLVAWDEAWWIRQRETHEKQQVLWPELESLIKY